MQHTDASHPETADRSRIEDCRIPKFTAFRYITKPPVVGEDSKSIKSNLEAKSKLNTLLCDPENLFCTDTRTELEKGIESLPTLQTIQEPELQAVARAEARAMRLVGVGLYNAKPFPTTETVVPPVYAELNPLTIIAGELKENESLKLLLNN